MMGEWTKLVSQVDAVQPYQSTAIAAVLAVAAPAASQSVQPACFGVTSYAIAGSVPVAVVVDEKLEHSADL